LVSLLCGYITKLVESNKWFGDREEKWEVVTGRGYCRTRSAVMI
jgi:hypothetical protein